MESLALKPNDFNEEGSENGKASSKVLSWQSLLKSHLSSFNVLLHCPHLLQLFYGAGHYKALQRWRKGLKEIMGYFSKPFRSAFHGNAV